MIWLALVALGNMGVSIWLVRENRRYAQMAISKHVGEYTAMVRAEAPQAKPAKKEKEAYHTWRNPSEGVSP